MARQRVRAARRKQRDERAHQVASGVYQVARELGQDPPAQMVLPVAVLAPVQYAAEQLAYVTAQRHKLSREQMDRLAVYYMTAALELLVAMFANFDEEHFAAWSGAHDHQLSSGAGPG